MFSNLTWAKPHVSRSSPQSSSAEDVDPPFEAKSLLQQSISGMPFGSTGLHEAFSTTKSTRMGSLTHDQSDRVLYHKPHELSADRDLQSSCGQQELATPYSSIPTDSHSESPSPQSTAQIGARDHDMISKRTLQNRRAQREFRERRANYLKMLEAKVRHYESRQVASNHRVQLYIQRLMAENVELRTELNRVLTGQRTSTSLAESNAHAPSGPNDGLAFATRSPDNKLSASTSSLESLWSQHYLRPVDGGNAQLCDIKDWDQSGPYVDDVRSKDIPSRRWSSASGHYAFSTSAIDLPFAPSTQEIQNHWAQVAAGRKFDSSTLPWDAARDDLPAAPSWDPQLSFPTETSYTLQSMGNTAQSSSVRLESAHLINGNHVYSGSTEEQRGELQGGHPHMIDHTSLVKTLASN